MRRCAALALWLLGCAEAPASGPRIALVTDFTDFRSWSSVALPERSLTPGHESSPGRRVYFDRAAPPLGVPFEEGAIIVKTIERGRPSEWEVHAMVKRSGGYNAAGAVGWEFFALAFDARDRLAIAWRGTGNDRAAYFDSRTGERRACNSCHGMVPERDYVFLRELYGERE